MNNGAYLMCEVTQTTAVNNTLESDDFLLCWHESKGDFIAKPALGTVCETDVYRVFREILTLKEKVRNHGIS